MPSLAAAVILASVAGIRTAGAADKIGSVVDLVLSPGINLSFSPVNGSNDMKIDITVATNRLAWLGFGFANGDVVSMGGSGAGADLFVCSDGAVKRYFVTRAIQPQNGVDVSGASCTTAAGSTIMKFQRDVAAHNATQVGIRPGMPQVVIFAEGDAGVVAMAYHNSNRGGRNVDFGTGAGSAPKQDLPTVLIVHVILMVMAWGFFLPFGAIAANRRMCGKPTWFTIHRGSQMTGWTCQLVAFILAIIYVSQSSNHFTNPHSVIGLIVVIIGTLQPVNAAFRPHPPESGETRTPTRQAWEYLHKGAGWTAIWTGIVNIFIGCAVISTKAPGAWILPLVASIILLLVVFAIAACASRNSAAEEVDKENLELASRS